jgi:hypothetical protein
MGINETLLSYEQLAERVDRLNDEVRELKARLCPRSHELADWCECGWSKALAEDKTP